jgi:uridine kinase
MSVSGIVGCGKTTTLQRLQSELATEKEIIISRSFVVDREKVNSQKRTKVLTTN